MSCTASCAARTPGTKLGQIGADRFDIDGGERVDALVEASLGQSRRVRQLERQGEASDTAEEVA